MNIAGTAGVFTQEFWEIPVLYEDEHLLALNKPACLLTSPDRYDPERPNLMRLLHTHIARGIPWAKDLGLSYLANAHRLNNELEAAQLVAAEAIAGHPAAFSICYAVSGPVGNKPGPWCVFRVTPVIDLGVAIDDDR